MHFLKSKILFILATATIVCAEYSDTTTTTSATAVASTDCPASCNNDCAYDTAGTSPQPTNQQGCANIELSTSSSSTMLVTGSLTASSVISTSTATATKAVTTDNGESDQSESDGDDGFKEGHPTKSYSGLQSNNDDDQKSTEGRASQLQTNYWIALAGLSLGVVL